MWLKNDFLINVWGYDSTHVPEIQATRNTSYLTASKSLNGRKIARMAPILTIFGPNRSRRRDLFFEKFSNERRRHRRLVLVSSSPSSSPPSSPSSPQHNYLRSQLLRAAVRCFFGFWSGSGTQEWHPCCDWHTWQGQWFHRGARA